MKNKPENTIPDKELHDDCEGYSWPQPLNPIKTVT